MSMNDNMQTIFNIESEKPEQIQGQIITRDGNVIVPHADKVEENVEYDYTQTRANLHSLLSQGQDALLSALEVAKQSENPRAFEVVGGLMKQLADINGQLLDLTEKRQKLMSKKEEASQPGAQVTNNNAIFVGSTSELNHLIKKMNGGN